MKNNKIWFLPWINVFFFIISWGLITNHYIAASLLFIVVSAGTSKKVTFNFGLRFGRKAVITTLSLTVCFILFALWDKRIAAGEVMYFVMSWLPVTFSPLILKDVFNHKPLSNEAFPELKRETPFSPLPEARPNLSEKRLMNQAYSYPSLVSMFNGVYPRAIYSLIIWAACIFCLPESAPLWLKIILSLTVMLNLIDKRRNKRKFSEWLTYLISFMITATLVMLLLIFIQGVITKISYSWMSKQNMSGWFNNSYSQTQIGKNGSFDDGQDLLLRIIWNEKNGDNLLPATYFDLYNEDNSSWTVAPDFVAGKALNVYNGTIKFPKTNEMALTDLSFLNKSGNLKKYNASKPSVDMDGKNAVKEEGKESYVVILGQILKNTRSVSALPLPTNTTYIIGDQGNSSFTKYASGTIMFAHNSSLVNWQVPYIKKEYLDLHLPVNFDLTYPEKYNDIFAKILKDSGIKENDSADLKVIKMQSYFINNYHYSLDLLYNGKPRTLEDFFTVDKRGHCEFFATGMTLMLRYMGIPSRYSTGFLVSENHPEEVDDMYWIRKKDAHAWASYWNGKGWKFVDATPYNNGSWSKDWDQPLYDKFIHFQYVLDNISIDEVRTLITSKYSIAFLGLFIMVIIILLIKRKNNSKSKKTILYITDKNEKQMKNQLKYFLKKYPKEKGLPWLTWAYNTKNEDVIKIVNHFYNKRY